MAKFYGEIGYGETVETPAESGVFVEVITEVAYYGDVIRNSRKLESGEGLNDNISVGNTISVVADEYANAHFHTIKYIRWAGVNWTVSNVVVQAPRLVLTLGSVYNGPTS